MPASDFDRDNGKTFVTVDDGGENKLKLSFRADGYIILNTVNLDQADFSVRWLWSSPGISYQGHQIGLRVDPATGDGYWVGPLLGIAGASTRPGVFKRVAGVLTELTLGSGYDISILGGDQEVEVRIFMIGSIITAYFFEVSSGGIIDVLNVTDTVFDGTSPSTTGIARFTGNELTDIVIDKLLVREIA